MKKKISLLSAVFLGITISLFAQINKPSLSPKINKETTIGLANVQLEYGQPTTQGREIFGALIPYGKVWRTGANSSTKLTTDREIELAGQKIPAGTYGLYTIPEKGEWTIIIHKNSKLWGAGGYNETEDLVRFKVPSTPLKDAVETLSINFENFTTNGGALIIRWENTMVSIPVLVDADEAIFKEIEAKVIDATEPVNAQTYFDAAQFYYHKGKELDKAATWFDKAIELSPRAFWFKYYRAELALEMGDKKMAKEWAMKSLEQAKKGSADYGYIAKNELLLKKL